MQQSQNLSCPICFCEYNLDDHLPKNLPWCGHTICAKCLQNTFDYNKRECPFDKTRFPDDSNIHSFTTNHALVELIQYRSLWKSCPIHNKPMELLCCDEKCSLCMECALFGGHQAHKIIQITDMKPEIEKRSNLLRDLLDDLQKSSAKLRNITLDHQSSLLKAVTSQFEELRTLLHEKEKEITENFQVFFSKVQNYLDSSSDNYLENQILEKTEDYKNFTKSDKLFEICHENLSEILNHVEKTLSSRDFQIKSWDKSLHQLQSDLKNTFDTQLISVYHLELPTKFTSTAFDSLLLPPQEIEEKHLTTELNLQTSFSFNFQKDVMEIISNHWQPKDIRIRSESLSKTRQIHIDFDLLNFNEYDFKALEATIWPRLQKINLIKVTATSQASLTEKSLLRVLKVVFSKPQHLSRIEINFSWNQNVNESFSYFADHILSKVNQLESFSLILNNCEITFQNIQKFVQGILPHLGTLKTYTLDLTSLSLPENVFSLLFAKMPALETLNFCLDGTNLNDKIAQFLIQKSLLSAHSLKTLELSFWQTAITDLTVKDLLRNLSSVKKLHLNLQSTDISDQGFHEFLLKKQDPLQNLEIDISNTRVSKIIKSKIDKLKS